MCLFFESKHQTPAVCWCNECQWGMQRVKRHQQKKDHPRQLQTFTNLQPEPEPVKFVFIYWKEIKMIALTVSLFFLQSCFFQFTSTSTLFFVIYQSPSKTSHSTFYWCKLLSSPSTMTRQKLLSCTLCVCVLASQCVSTDHIWNGSQCLHRKRLSS